MKFWDASAIVPLLVAQRTTQNLRAILAKDQAIIVWWASSVECVSALARLEREGAIDETMITGAQRQLAHLTANWTEVEATDVVREAAVRFLRVHSLRAADALQLAAAFVAADRRPETLELITLDDRLGAAARKEGFIVTP